MANGFQPNITENMSGVSGTAGSFWTDVGNALKNPNVINALSTAGAGFSQMGRDKDSIGIGEILGQVAGQYTRNKAFQKEALAQKGAKDDIMSQVLDLLKGGSRGLTPKTEEGITSVLWDGDGFTLKGTGPVEDTNAAQALRPKMTLGKFAGDPNTASIKANQPPQLGPTTGAVDTVPFLGAAGADNREIFSPLYSALLGE